MSSADDLQPLRMGRTPRTQAGDQEARLSVPCMCVRVYFRLNSRCFFIIGSYITLLSLRIPNHMVQRISSPFTQPMSPSVAVGVVLLARKAKND